LKTVQEQGLNVVPGKKGIQIPPTPDGALKVSFLLRDYPQKRPINDVAGVFESKAIETYGKTGEGLKTSTRRL
jgi:hypothetical protein